MNLQNFANDYESQISQLAPKLSYNLELASLTTLPSEPSTSSPVSCHQENFPWQRTIMLSAAYL